MNFDHFYSWEPRIEKNDNTEPENVDINDVEIDEEDKFFPYIGQAGQMARLGLIKPW